jgi:Zn-finger domain-containing protein
MLTLKEVKETLDRNGMAYPYPRLGKVSINGGRGQEATKEALAYCVAYYKAKRKAHNETETY